ncbi:MAG: hypothetical protein KC657_05900 [Myxococcales bacterium]|nr:hypothetical protein [Myxococcales bacterium]
MPLERAQRTLQRLRAIAAGELSMDAPPLRLDGELALGLFRSQLLCRLTDVMAHELRAKNQGYYTICSAGHEGNVVLGNLTGPHDPALLHYRSGAFFLERARCTPYELAQTEVPGVFELLLSLVASSDDPIAGGRHKVFGSVPLGIPPQTSTIASHLPRAVGLAMALERAGRMGRPVADKKAIVVCTFGDASINHSTAQGALNAASWAAYQKLPMPVLFVCEDNGIGVSVRTPPDWVRARMQAMPAFEYVYADGTDITDAYMAASHAVASCRERRAPVLLHMTCARVWGHAGSDVDREYRAAEEIAAAEDLDPVLRTAQSLLDADVLSGREMRHALDELEERTRELADEAVRRPKLETRGEVMATIAPAQPALVHEEACRSGYADEPEEWSKPRALAHGIRAGLADLMRKYPEMMLFGEDVAEKGGVYGVTVGLWKTFGPRRVFNTLLDEQTILGIALGAGQAGLLPVPEIQFLAYLHNAEDQIRGEAATQSFFSRAQLKNPMVVRIAGLGYQKGFGGHFHNDDSLAVLRDIPGIVVGVPCRADDAVRMLRTLAAAAKVDGRVTVIVEPIGLYHTRDLHAPGDGKWAFAVPPQGEAMELGEVGVYHEDGGTPPELVIFTYGNGVPMSLRARERVGARGVRIVDLRWISPLPVEAIQAHGREAASVLVVDECRRSGNVGEAIAACLLEGSRGRPRPFARVASADSFVPLADAANLVLVQEHEIEDAARRLLSRVSLSDAQTMESAAVRAAPPGRPAKP